MRITRRDLIISGLGAAIALGTGLIPAERAVRASTKIGIIDPESAPPRSNEYKRLQEGLKKQFTEKPISHKGSHQTPSNHERSR